MQQLPVRSDSSLLGFWRLLIRFPFQVLDFLSRHSSTVVILLKNETEDMSLSLLEEIHLLVSLCGQVLPLVPRADLVRLSSSQN